MSDTLILCYHAVASGWPDPVAVEEQRFAAQMSLLRRLGYRGVTFTEAVLGPQRGRRVAITFDDGFHSVFARALPVLEQLRWPATIFVVTDYVGGERPIAWPDLDRWLGTPYEHELRTVDWSQLEQLLAVGWEVGSHTCTHPHLTRLTLDEARQELAESRRVVSDRLGACPSIAYPYGDVDPQVVEVARAAGYQTAAALPPGRLHEVRPLEWPRVGIYNRDPLHRFLLKSLPARRQLEVAAERLQRLRSGKA